MSVETISAERMEHYLIGALLMDRDAIAAVSDRITAEAFSHPRYRAIYGAIQRCWARRQPPDIANVHDELEHDPMFRDEATWMGAALDLSGAMTAVVADGWPFNAPYYADRVVDHARRRAVSNAGADLMQAAHQGKTIDPAQVMHQVIAGFDRFGASSTTDGLRTYDEIVPAYQDRIVAMLNGEMPSRATAAGFRALDRKLAGGFYPGELVIVAARPGMGKTAFGMQLAHNVARAGGSTLVFSAEMGRESLLKRAASEVSGLPADTPEHELRGEAADRFLQALERLRKLPVSIDDTPNVTTAQMLVRVQKAQARGPVGLVVFDYIELAGDVTSSDSEERRVNDIVKALRRMARICDVPVLALCQLNRQVETRRNKRPILADLRYSGSIEQDADKVLFLYRHDYYVQMGNASAEAGREGIVEVIVSKHRNGSVGTVDLRFQPERMRFFGIDTTQTLPGV